MVARSYLSPCGGFGENSEAADVAKILFGENFDERLSFPRSRKRFSLLQVRAEVYGELP